MGLFSGQVQKLGVKLSTKLRERALAFHEQAAEAMTSSKPGLANKLVTVGETLEVVAEVIEDAVTSDDD